MLVRDIALLFNASDAFLKILRLVIGGCDNGDPYLRCIHDETAPSMTPVFCRMNCPSAYRLGSGPTESARSLEETHQGPLGFLTRKRHAWTVKPARSNP